MTTEAPACPDYSFGKIEEGHKNALLRVNEGEFSGSMFSFKDVKLEEANDGTEEGVLSYSVIIESFLLNGTLIESPTEDSLISFYQSCCSPILYDICSKSFDYKDGRDG